MTDKIITEIEWHRYPEVKPKNAQTYFTNKGTNFYSLSEKRWLVDEGVTLWAEDPTPPVIEDKIIDLRCLIGSGVPMLFGLSKHKGFIQEWILNNKPYSTTAFDPKHWVSNRGHNPWPEGVLIDVEYRSSDIDRSFGVAPRVLSWSVDQKSGDIMASKPSVDEDGNIMLEDGWRMPE